MSDKKKSNSSENATMLANDSMPPRMMPFKPVEAKGSNTAPSKDTSDKK